MTRCLPVLVSASLASLASAAWADPGDHVPVGDAVLTPSIQLGVQSSTNPYHLAAPDATSGGVAMVVSPAVDLTLARTDLEAGVYGSYDVRKYFTPGDRGLDRWNEFSLGGHVDARKDTTIGFRLAEGLSQRLYATLADPDAPYARQLHNRAEAALVVRPRKDAEIAVGARLGYDAFGVPDVEAGGTAPLSNRITVGPQLDAGVMANDQVSVVGNFNLDFMSYGTDVVDLANGSQQALNDGTLVRLKAGVLAQVSDQVALRALVGYGGATFDDPAGGTTSPTGAPQTGTTQTGTGTETTETADIPDPTADVAGAEHLLANVALTYVASERSQVELGFDRDFRPSYLTNYVAYNRGYANATVRLAEDFGLEGQFSAAGQGFAGAEARRDVLLTGKLDASYFLQEWGQLTIGAAKSNRTSSNGAVAYDETLAHVSFTLTY